MSDAMSNAWLIKHFLQLYALWFVSHLLLILINNKNKYFEIVIKIIYKNITSAPPVPNQGLAKF